MIAKYLYPVVCEVRNSGVFGFCKIRSFDQLETLASNFKHVVFHPGINLYNLFYCVAIVHSDLQVRLYECATEQTCQVPLVENSN